MTIVTYAVTEEPLAFVRSHDFLSEGAPVVLVRTQSHGATHKHGSRQGRLLLILLKALPHTMGAHTWVGFAINAMEPCESPSQF